MARSFPAGTHYRVIPNLTSEIIWGLLARGIGLVYFISFASLWNQVLPGAGSKGYAPISNRLARIRRDFPSWRRYFYFPTLSWLNQSDIALGSLPWLGMLASLFVLAGGPLTFWGFLACYLIYLSLDRVMVLIFPWDCMLFEAGLFALFLPALRTLPEWGLVSAPMPAIAWLYRLLLFRVLFGFGKFKFLGATSQDTAYLRGFLVNQPLPSPVGWLAQKLPLWMLKASLILMFIVEIPVAFTVFFPGRVSIAGALVIDAFMLVIWLSGTFGYFSLIMMVVSLSWLDTQTASAFTFADFFSWQGQPIGHTIVHALVLLHVIGSVLSFAFNSYCASSWLLWSFWLRIRPRFLIAPIAFYRALHPFRWLHAYGVFPPHPAPAVKIVPVMEVSWNGDDWLTLEHRYSPTTERSRPKFCAPYHARLDQSLIYETFGLTDAGVMRNFIGWWEPYFHSHIGGSWLLMRRALTGFFPSVVFDPKSLAAVRDKPPTVARVRTYMLEPTSLGEAAKGVWWKRTLVGPHSGPITMKDGFWEHLVPPPELWHFEDVFWLHRSSLGPLMKRAMKGEDPHSLVLVDADDIERSDVDLFWSEFVPLLAGHDASDWRGLRRLVESVREKYGRPRLYRFERIAARYGVLLFAKLEPLFLDRGILPVFGKVKATLDVKTYYHLGLVTREVIRKGRDAYDAVIQSPALAADHAAKMTLASGNFLLALFRYDIFVSQAQKLRLLQCYLEHEGRRPPTPAEKRGADKIDGIMRRLWGAVDMVDFLRTQFKDEEDVVDVKEEWPRFAIGADGVISQIPLTPSPLPRTVEGSIRLPLPSGEGRG